MLNVTSTKHLGLLGAPSQVMWPPVVSCVPLVCFVSKFFGPQALCSFAHRVKEAGRPHSPILLPNPVPQSSHSCGSGPG